MIQRPPACRRHAAELPGKALIVEPDECPFCWAEEREAKAANDPPSLSADAGASYQRVSGSQTSGIIDPAQAQSTTEYVLLCERYPDHFTDEHRQIHGLSKRAGSSKEERA